MKLEINQKFVKSNDCFEYVEKDPITKKEKVCSIMVTPPVSEDYWMFRVKLSNGQALLGFPKFGSIGIGFAIEDDWNTNLPSTNSTSKIYNHIKCNKGPAIENYRQIKLAIEIIQDAAARYKSCL